MAKHGKISKLGRRGQAMVEMAICLPVLLVIVMGIIDFGYLYYGKMSVANASREGARYAVVHAADASVAADVEARAKAMLTLDPACATVTLAIAGQDATVTVTASIKPLTPLPGIFTGGEPIEMTSVTTMMIG